MEANLMKTIKRKAGLTDAEYAEELILRGRALQRQAESHRQKDKFNLYSSQGRKLNTDGAWLIQQGLLLKKRGNP